MTFSRHREEGYFVIKLTGQVTDAELLDSYAGHYESPDWTPQLKELVDLSEVDAVRVTTGGLRKLSSYIERLLVERGVTSLQTAVYAPRDLPFGLSRVYEAMAEASPETVRVFRRLDEAKAWLEEPR
jgi:hypothetical protein